MAFLGKEYTYYKHENFDGFLKSVGVSEDKIQAMGAFKSTQKLVKNGDTYTFSQNSVEGPKEITFKSGVEFDDVIGLDKVPTKSTITVDGNKVTQTVSADKGVATFVKEYNGDDLVVTITSSTWDGVAKRFYKA